MKILKVYDKINRNIFQSDTNTGTVTVKEFYNDTDYFTILISAKVFKTKNERMAYFSCVNTIGGVDRETLDITNKYIVFRTMNENGLLLHSDRFHLKDKKSIVTLDRIYDHLNEFIELENHKGKRTIKFKLKTEILNNFLNTK